MEFRSRSRLQEGFSLVEVLIAIVILAIAGGVLLKVLQETSLTNRSFSNKTLAFVALNKAATQVESSPFIPCTKSGGASDYYSSGLPGNVTVKVVEGLVSTSGNGNNWVSCSNWSLDTPPVVQRVVLQAPYVVNTALSSSDNLKYLFKEIIKTSTGKQSSIAIKPSPTNFTLLRVSSIDARFATQNRQTISLDVAPYSCKDVFLWSSASTGGLTVTVNPDCTAIVSASRDPVYIPFTSSGTVVFSGVDLLDKSQLYQATVNVTINFPAPAISGFTVTTPTGGNICRALATGCPQSGVAGNQVTITGSNLLGNPNNIDLNPVVLFAGSGISNIVSASDTAIVATVPTGVETGKISLTTQGGTDQSALAFKVISTVSFDESQTWLDVDSGATVGLNLDPLDPLGYGFYPTGASPGLSITIAVLGDPRDISYVVFSNNVNDAQLTYPALDPASPSYILSKTSQMVTVKVPTGATKGKLKIVTAAGTSISSQRQFWPVPNIVTVKDGVTDSTPIGITSGGILGAKVTNYGAEGYGSGITNRNIQITGSGLLGISKVQFTKTKNSSGEVTSWVDATACGYTGPNVVDNNYFYYDRSSQPTRQDARIGVCVPAGAIAGPIRAFNDIGEGTSRYDFHPEPKILSLTSAPGGSSISGGGLGVAVTINGSGFFGASRIDFNGGTAARPTISAVCTSSTSSESCDSRVTVSVPISANDGPINVTTSIDIGSSTYFYVKPRINLSSLPTSPKVGDQFTLTGTGFSGITATSGSSGTSGVKIAGLAPQSFTLASSPNSDTSMNIKFSCAQSSGSLVLTSPLGTNETQPTLSIGSLSPTISSYGTNTSGSAATWGTDKKFLASSPTGATLRVNGTNLNCISAINWGSSPLTSVVASATLVTATLPTSATSSDKLDFVSFTPSYSAGYDGVLWNTPQLLSVNAPSISATGIAFSDASSTKSGSNFDVTIKYTSGSQRFTAGQTVSISGLTPSGFNNTGVIKSASTSPTSGKYSFVVTFSTNPCGASNSCTATSGTGTATVSNAVIRGSSSVTINGTGFSGFVSGSTCPIGLSIMFGATEISCSTINPSALTDTSITFTMPSSSTLPSSGSINITVKNPFGTSASSVTVWVT